MEIKNAYPWFDYRIPTRWRAGGAHPSQRPTRMEPRISLITLGVKDLERSLRFYRDGLGLPTTWGLDKGVVFFQTQGVC